MKKILGVVAIGLLVQFVVSMELKTKLQSRHEIAFRNLTMSIPIRIIKIKTLEENGDLCRQSELLSKEIRKSIKS